MTSIASTIETIDTEDVMEEDDDDDDDEDNDSIRTFTAARLNPKSRAVLGSLRSAKSPKPENPQVKSKLAGGGLLETTVKEERVPSQTRHAVKEEPAKGVLTESIQTSGAYISREEGLKREMLLEHNDSWPFKEPVDARDVTDYYKIIKDRIDLKTMSKRVGSEQYYVPLEMFVADVKRMCSNARIYNSPKTIYYRCAKRVESFYMYKVQTLQ